VVGIIILKHHMAKAPLFSVVLSAFEILQSVNYLKIQFFIDLENKNSLKKIQWFFSAGRLKK
jgi:hypothetical protein